MQREVELKTNLLNKSQRCVDALKETPDAQRIKADKEKEWPTNEPNSAVRRTIAAENQAKNPDADVQGSPGRSVETAQYRPRRVNTGRSCEAAANAVCGGGGWKHTSKARRAKTGGSRNINDEITRLKGRGLHTPGREGSRPEREASGTKNDSAEFKGRQKIGPSPRGALPSLRKLLNCIGPYTTGLHEMVTTPEICFVQGWLKSRAFSFPSSLTADDEALVKCRRMIRRGTALL